MINEYISQKLICPKCRKQLLESDNEFLCLLETCGAKFPIVNGVPVIIDDEESIFSIDDVIKHNTYFPIKSRKSKLYETLISLIPNITSNTASRRVLRRFYDILKNDTLTPPQILIVGSYLGAPGINKLLDFKITNIDVSFVPGVSVICDLHRLPFENETFDGVVIQNVLEHVIDPMGCVANIYRVLKKDGIVFSETPFMQQVHAGKYDFTRFTLRGHRRLYRNFEEIECGWVAGPGSVLAWSTHYFFLSFCHSKWAIRLVKILSGFCLFFLKWFDYLLPNTVSVSDGASSVYFLGRKSPTCLSDKELLKTY